MVLTADSIAGTLVGVAALLVVIVATVVAQRVPAVVVAAPVAALLLALVLARGEDAVWFVAGLLRPCLPTVTRLRVPSLRSPAPAPWGGLPHSVTVLGGVGRRGPPVRRALP